MTRHLVAGAFAATALTLALPAHAQDIVVMPTGDSLTAGYPGVGGYDTSMPPCSPFFIST